MQVLHGIDKLHFLQKRLLNTMPSTASYRTFSLNVENLGCIRGERHLFDDLSITLNNSECVHVVGANGSGKTSLLRLICGISRIDTGDILYSGQSITGNREYFQDIAYIGHKDGLKNELTAAENLEYYQQLNGRADTKKVDAVLATMGILPCADLNTVKLSFGQRRRLAFARLLINRFPIWVLDEPFTGIDQAGRELIEQQCVAHLSAQGSIILTNHQSLTNSVLSPFLRELNL